MASHESAASLFDLPVEKSRVEVTILWPRSVELAGVAVHRSRRLEAIDTMRVRGIPATSVARTVIDLASVLPTRTLEDVVDHVLARRLIPISYLGARLEALRPGRDGAAALATLLQKRPTGRRPRQSDAERTLLSALREAGVPLPGTQVPIRLPKGGWVYPDFCYEEEKLIVEVDSYVHHSSLTDWESDHVRTQDLVALQWRVLPVTASEIARCPAAVAAKVRDALGGYADLGRRSTSIARPGRVTTSPGAWLAGPTSPPGAEVSSSTAHGPASEAGKVKGTGSQ